MGEWIKCRLVDDALWLLGLLILMPKPQVVMTQLLMLILSTNELRIHNSQYKWNNVKAIDGVGKRG